jgi:hypothetical protein
MMGGAANNAEYSPNASGAIPKTSRSGGITVSVNGILKKMRASP